jgi:hypothetical protein
LTEPSSIAIERRPRAVVDDLPQTTDLGVDEVHVRVVLVFVLVLIVLVLVVLVLLFLILLLVLRGELVLHLLEDLDELGGRADAVVADLDAALEVHG